MRRIRRQRRLGCEQLENRLTLSASCLLPPLAEAQDAPKGSGPTMSSLVLDGAGGTFSSSRELGPLDGSQELNGQVGGGDRRDYFTFTLEAPGRVNIGIDALRQDIDLYLFDSQRKTVAYSIRGGSLSESINRELTPGRYYVLVVPYGSSSSTYRMTLQAVLERPQPEDGAGDTFRDARNIGRLASRQVHRDLVGDDDPADVFRFDVAGDVLASFQLGQMSQDLDLYLYDSQQRLVARSINAGSAQESVQARIGQGSYYLVVDPYRSAESSYELSLSARSIGSRPTPPPPSDTTPTPVVPPTAPPSNPAPPTNPAPPIQPSPDGQPLTDVPYFGGTNEWNVNYVNAPEAWARGYTGEDVVVAVIDTGVDLNHRDLAGNIWRNSDETPGDRIDNDGNGFVDDVFGWDFAHGDNNPDDTNGHGTHVAGTIAAGLNGFGATGIAPDAQIMPVQVLGDSGSGSSFGVASGIRYAVDNGADVINMSLGGGFSSSIYLALQYATRNDVFVAIASGNESSSTPSYPAAHSRQLTSVISVGAFDRSGRQASFSNGVGGSGAVQVDAPGVSIYSTLPNDRYGRFSGTSMATPHVAGMAALTLSANPSLTSSQLRSLLAQGANRSIRNSDSIGSINAVTTVSSALGGSTTASLLGGTAAPGGPLTFGNAVLFQQIGAGNPSVHPTSIDTHDPQGDVGVTDQVLASVREFGTVSGASTSGASTRGKAPFDASSFGHRRDIAPPNGTVAADLAARSLVTSFPFTPDQVDLAFADLSIFSDRQAV